MPAFRRIARAAALLVLPAAALAGPAPSAFAGAAHRIRAENAYHGTRSWQARNEAQHREIEGYASKTSVDRGGRIRIYVNTEDSHYRLAVYRMGWYGGRGARRVKAPVRRRGIDQPAPEHDPATGRTECHWRHPFVLHVPRHWVSGVYLVKLTALDSGWQRHVIFTVRDDDRRSAYLFQSSVNTYQAYNDWGGKSLYDFNSPTGRASEVSFNRPYSVGPGQFLQYEYPMVRWLERRGYGVSYSTDVDTARRGDGLLRHRALLVVGHDEYWTPEQRDNVEAARAAGVNLGVFAADSALWQVAYDGRSMARVAAFRDPAIGRPESTLLGVMHESGGFPVDGDLRFADPVGDPRLAWLFKGTGLHPGTVMPRLLGYEIDRALDPGPPGCRFEIASSPYTTTDGMQTSVASSTVWTGRGVPSAWVFASGTIWWSWGLDAWSTRHIYGFGSRVSPAIRRLTANLLERFREPPGIVDC